MTRVTYTADGGHYRVGGHGFDPGDERDVDDDLAEYLASLEPFDVEGADSDEPSADDLAHEPSGPLPFNPESHAVSELRAKLGDVDDPAAVRALRSLEGEQKERTTAMDAFDDRISELED